MIIISVIINIINRKCDY